MKPQIVVPDTGVHNRDLDESARRLEDSKTYQDLSTVIICPTRGVIPAKVVQSWMGLIRPMNQKVLGPLFAIGMEVGDAYNSMFEMVVNHPEFSKWKYILTIEEDNMPPPDGLMKLYENMDKYDVIQGLYWTKGQAGQPMIYGNPDVMPKNFIPQKPIPGVLQHCNGLGMGFNLFKISMFQKVPRPWFRTVQQYTPGQGTAMYTQDLYFYERAGKEGFKFACDNRVLVAHYDLENDICW
ncbi:hypothetical protein A2Z67_02285 [Candidatus Woesebacteria bacterium RBG_13_36_22]|uniref:Glycosyltransferase 2-like domain-containing protein n=1 Tax=Candidatus Woesebacteria bacterium RBG_13_36_22 TaxID=1802478 RepID=A0A1F7X150_9BACT|nr:MAG: hypothetical protein A2Z67_02285 [Candidatus Woesebacteria bacterium RBG_13_36_22]